MTSIPRGNQSPAELSSLAPLLKETRSELLNVIAFLEHIKTKFLFYQMSASTQLSQLKAQEILREMKEWPREMQVRTEQVYHDFLKEQEVAVAIPTLLEVLKRQLGEINFIFSRLREGQSEESLAHFQSLIELLQKEPASKELISQMKKALENIHQLFLSLLEAVHAEEKELREGEKLLQQIDGNRFIEENQAKIAQAIRELFDRRYILQQHLNVEFVPFPEATIKSRIWKEVIESLPRTILIVTLTLEGEPEHPSWEGRMRFESKKKCFEAIFGERRGFEYTPQEQKKYTYSEQALRDFPANFIQYIFNSKLKEKKRKY